MLVLLRLLATAGATASWIVIFVAVIIAVFVIYLGITLYATLRATDAEQQKIRYRVFRDLLHWFDRGRRR